MRLLFVEDESITRKSILKHIPWGEIGIKEVKAAPDAAGALNIVDEWTPDIVLSDIRMRGMDGIELCRELLRRIPECQIIFLSGYSQKEYLKAAIELGAVQYLEKPVSVQELENAVKIAAKKIEQLSFQKFVTQKYNEHFQVIQKDILKRLFWPVDEEGRRKALEEAGLLVGKDKEMRVCFLIPQKNDTDFYQYVTQVFVPECQKMMHVFSVEKESERILEEPEHTVMILSAESGKLEKNAVEMKKVSWLVSQAPEEARFFLAMGERIRIPDKLNISLQSAKDTAECLSYKGYGTIAFSEEEHFSQVLQIPSEFGKKFQCGLENKDINTCKAALNDICRFLTDQYANLNWYVKNYYFSLFVSIEKHLGALDGKEREGFTNKLEKAQTFQEFYRLILTLTEKKLESDEERYAPVVSCVMGEIQKRYYDKNLSVAQLAEEQMLTPAYLSALFHSQTGKTIKQYLIDVRIGHAKELLKDHKYKFYQVSDMVGYQDAAYFTRLFRAQTGMTPSEYREKMR